MTHRRWKLASVLVLAACSPHAPRIAATAPSPAAQAEWTHGTVCYEVFVRSFYDSDGDGIGDLKGLVRKLDYINDGNPASRSDLGATCIWLMPVTESPSYHGYDVSDYYRVEPAYGTNDDFKRLVAEAHRRGIKVLVDMVLNHSSSEHPFFQAALRDTASPYRNWYRWSATKPNELGPWGQVAWHKSPIRDEWYYGIFWSGMPDLNYTWPPVVAEAKKVARYWLTEMGVDGFRLDAIPFLVEEPGRLQGTAGTHAVLRDYQAFLRTVKPDVFTVGEVYDSTGAMLRYYPDQLDEHFAFEVSDSIIAAVRSGSARGLLASVLRLQSLVPNARYAPFLSNHDQVRVRTQLGGDLAKSRLAAVILLTMPGLPFVYYGEEIGMSGAKPDERLRTPMQWSPAPGSGFTSGAPWERMQDDSLTVTVEAQERDPSSLLALYRRLIHLRAGRPALGAGTLVPLTTSNAAVGAWIRRHGRSVALVVVNLSPVAQSGVTLAGADGTLPRGRWVLRDLLGNARAARGARDAGGAGGAGVVIGAAGGFEGYVPLDTLAATTGYVFDLSPSSRHAPAAALVPRSSSPASPRQRSPR